MQIKKCNYKAYNKDGELTHTGQVYKLFYSPLTAEGLIIPFTLKVNEVENKKSQKRECLNEENKTSD